MNQNRTTLLQELRSLLKHHQAAGIESYPASDDVARFLAVDAPATKEKISPEKKRGPVEIAEPISARKVVPDITGKKDAAPLSSLQDIADEVAGCTSCSLCTSRSVPVSGFGQQGARLLIVGDWLVWERDKPALAGCVFGIEQDRMLGKMMEAIHIPQQQVFVTNVIKCAIPSSCQPKAEHAQKCLSYLYRQIRLLQPALILSMGMIATKTLLQRKESLSRLRGRLLSCQVPDGVRIPLVATYHPTYLMQNPEMKRATWYDLQLLAKHLKTL